MDFSFTDEQQMLRDMVGSYLAERQGFEARQAAMESADGRVPGLWSALATELGVLGASLPEEAGGLGGGAVETLILMEAAGEHLLLDPYLETVVLCGGLLKHSGWNGAGEWLAKIAAGETILAFAGYEPQSRYDLFDVTTTARKSGDGWVIDGRKAVVHAAPWADRLLVTARTSGGQRDRDGVSLFLVDKAANGVATRDYPTVDGRRASEVAFDGAPALLIAENAADLIERGVDEATAAVCAEGVGVMRRLHRDTLDYARQRKQFGRPIADFQVLQHRMVDMFMELEQSVSMTYYATLMLDAPAPERTRAIAAAKARVARALKHVGEEAVQIHGGIGMTNELALGWYFKRATVLESLFGDADHHLARFQGLGALTR
ncbi:MAG: acyl-CoA dehydrogenase family protein [Caulobacteraceae bacterium]